MPPKIKMARIKGRLYICPPTILHSNWMAEVSAVLCIHQSLYHVYPRKPIFIPPPNLCSRFQHQPCNIRGTNSLHGCINSACSRIYLIIIISLYCFIIYYIVIFSHIYYTYCILIVPNYYCLLSAIYARLHRGIRRVYE